MKFCSWALGSLLQINIVFFQKRSIVPMKGFFLGGEGGGGGGGRGCAKL